MLLIFSFSPPLSFILDNFYWCIFKFTNYFLWYLHRLLSLSGVFLNALLCFTFVNVLFCFFSYFLFFILRLYIFSIVSKTFKLTSWITLITAVSKSFPDNSNIYVISELTSAAPPAPAGCQVSLRCHRLRVMHYICVLLDTMSLRALLTMLIFLF